ncbi:MULTISPECIES: dipeptide ABC transporter ATP-binding protein [unclassified Streptomyces]|uniref:dipeptide ABC transporter ATP-binding protein n=1 Tax=unclassified Streptomyces TaxID=2593676 RepID=UPI002E2ABA54|nr:dipeptide ABC transporter ATP-binding protein [Streptomyces sp. NBC_00223]
MSLRVAPAGGADDQSPHGPAVAGPESAGAGAAATDEPSVVGTRVPPVPGPGEPASGGSAAGPLSAAATPHAGEPVTGGPGLRGSSGRVAPVPGGPSVADAYPGGPDTAGLRVNGLGVAYDGPGGAAQVLHDVSFSVAPGEIFGLVGESGCGKSTLAYALARHLAPGGHVLGGEVRLDGTDVLALGAGELRRWRAGRLAFVHQDAAGSLDPTMRIGAQLDEILRLRGLTRAQASARTLELLRQVRLPDPHTLVRRYPHELSGGQQQRVGIAAALAVEPRLLVLDEPTTGLDASVEHEVLSLLAELRGELRAAVVFVSHDLGLVGRLCDRVGVLYAGRLVEVGAVRPVLDTPAHPYTSALLAAVPRLGVSRGERRLRPIPGGLPRPGATGTGCAFAPRCPRAEDACRAAEPALDPAAVPGRSVRCLHPGPGGATVPASPGTTPARREQDDRPVLLELRGLVRSYGRTAAVDHVDLTIHEGEVLGLVGESGSGKTTLARAVAGLGPDGKGELRLHGKKLASRLARRSDADRRRIQMVFQNPDATLNPSHTVRTVLTRALATLAGPEGPGALDRLTERTRIDPDLLDRRPDRLSGGQKQRVAIARSFAGSPDLVVCDEPVSSLDASVQAGVVELLAEQRDRTGTSYLFISHDLAVVGYLADRIAVMYRGAVVENGPAADVLHGPSHPYTAVLVAAASRAMGPVDTAPRPAGPVRAGAGCRFADRCPRRIDGLCDREVPPPRTVGPGHVVHCHLDVDALPVWRAPTEVPTTAATPTPTEVPTAAVPDPLP